MEKAIGTLGSRPPLADVVCSLNRTQNSLSVVLCGILLYHAIQLARDMKRFVLAGGHLLCAELAYHRYR